MFPQTDVDFTETGQFNHGLVVMGGDGGGGLDGTEQITTIDSGKVVLA
jgi:hypothetical protein